MGCSHVGCSKGLPKVSNSNMVLLQWFLLSKVVVPNQNNFNWLFSEGAASKLFFVNTNSPPLDVTRAFSSDMSSAERAWRSLLWVAKSIAPFGSKGNRKPPISGSRFAAGRRLFARWGSANASQKDNRSWQLTRQSPDHFTARRGVGG